MGDYEEVSVLTSSQEWERVYSVPWGNLKSSAIHVTAFYFFKKYFSKIIILFTVKLWFPKRYSKYHICQCQGWRELWQLSSHVLCRGSAVTKGTVVGYIGLVNKATRLVPQSALLHSLSWHCVHLLGTRKASFMFADCLCWAVSVWGSDFSVLAFTLILNITVTTNRHWWLSTVLWYTMTVTTSTCDVSFGETVF